MTASTDDRVLFDVDPEKRIATITLNNPGQRNSYDATMRDAIARYLDRVAEDDDAAAAIDRRQGRWEDALANFEKAKELDPRARVGGERLHRGGAPARGEQGRSRATLDT